MTTTGTVAAPEAWVARIIYKIECEGVPTDQYEEQWRLLMASDERDALRLAQKAGEEEAGAFTDRHGRLIVWKLLAVKELRPCQLQHGALLFSVVTEAEPVAAPVWSQQTA